MNIQKLTGIEFSSATKKKLRLQERLKTALYGSIPVKKTKPQPRLVSDLHLSVFQKKSRLNQRLAHSLQGSDNQQNLKQKQVQRLVDVLQQIKSQKEEDINYILTEPLLKPLITKIKTKVAEVISYF